MLYGLSYSYTTKLFFHLFIYTKYIHQVQYIIFLLIPFLDENKQRDNKSDSVYKLNPYVTHTVTKTCKEITKYK